MKWRAPVLNDVSSDLEDPPSYPSGRHGRYPEKFKALVRRHYPDVAPIHLKASPDEAYRIALETARREERWEIVHEDPGARVFEAVATTRVFRFKDDVVVRVRPDDGGCVVDVRSASRVGRGDLGANAERIRDFLASFQANLR